MGQYRGAVGIRWGTNGIGSTTFGASALMQSYDVEKKGDEFEAKDGAGDIRAWYGYNQAKEASFTFYVGAASAGSASAVIAPAFGDLITVTGTGGNATGSYWVVKSVSENAVNTDAVKITVKATEYTYITT